MTANDTTTGADVRNTLTDERRRDLLFTRQAERIAVLQDEIKTRQEEIDRLKTLILDSHPAGTYQAGSLKVQVKPGARRLDVRRFERAWPASEHPELWEVKPLSLSKIIEQIGRQGVADCIVSGKPTVVIA